MAKKVLLGKAPENPVRLGVRGWWGVLRRTVREFTDDKLLDLAAALTYYGLLSLFPGLVLLVSLVGLAGVDGQQTLIDNVRQLAPGQFRDNLVSIIEGVQGTAPTAGTVAIISLVVALWSASKYVAALIRALNQVYDIPEGRPVWKLAPLRVALTLAMVVLLAASALAVTFTGRLAEQAGKVLGFSSAFVGTWNVVKWPVLLCVVIVAVATLYWAAPNVRQPNWKWITPGCVLAVVSWVIASAAFALYVTRFGSYNKTYGALAGVVVFLIWVWVSNVVILLGAEFDAELVRGRRIAEGAEPDVEPYAVPRDTRKLSESEREELPEVTEE
ncbi:YihY/virulence factor BrkB family protein [Actinomadura parmotrematis]|uniref:YihY/virulence factor BrkB family protein n=1 Tax=Actinomadura parmotrematis TaxID=2864039 RepID=A0ABS7FRS1_9ACTN|nr:YihY/virulence factor BrkB family protein [Actinomadura parmotrematis]MBW8483082.1 YihY/virulence factor BrkB family protein [Actinomadura parmotrematis]